MCHFVTPLCHTVWIDWPQYPSAERTGNSANRTGMIWNWFGKALLNYVKLCQTHGFHQIFWCSRCPQMLLLCTAFSLWLLQAHATGSKNLQQSRWYVWWFLGSPVSRDLRRWSAPRQRCHNTIPKKKCDMKWFQIHLVVESWSSLHRYSEFLRSYFCIMFIHCSLHANTSVWVIPSYGRDGCVMLSAHLLQVREFLRGLHGVVAEDKEMGWWQVMTGRLNMTQVDLEKHIMKCRNMPKCFLFFFNISVFASFNFIIDHYCIFRTRPPCASPRLAPWRRIMTCSPGRHVSEMSRKWWSARSPAHLRPRLTSSES